MTRNTRVIDEVYCPACRKEHGVDPCQEMREGLWAIIKSKYKGKAYRWARGYLGFDTGEKGTWRRDD